MIGVRNYAVVTAAYWAFTLTDGALRLLVLLHFHELGYTPVQLAFLFLLYEFFGIVTNLVGGWLAARTCLRFTLVLGLALPALALCLLALLNREWTIGRSVAYVMGCQAKVKTPFKGILSNSTGINRLSMARLALFAARDVWFVVSVPIFLASVLGWSFTQIGAFLALWVIGYGAVQSVSPIVLARATRGRAPGPAMASALGLGLAAITALIPIGLHFSTPPAQTMVGGLCLFGVMFALNSSVHSYLVLAYSEADRVSLSVGFYYMANAAGRLLGTLLSGVLYQQAGVTASLWGAVVLAGLAGVAATFLPPVTSGVSWNGAASDD